MPAFKLGLIINPYAGIGGALALKGSDGEEVRRMALAQGAIKQANTKARLALRELLPLMPQIQVYTAAGEMGEATALELGFDTTVVYTPGSEQTEAYDTEQTAHALLQSRVDCLLFAGGDGTARNICDVVAEQLPVLGIPAGCKIHSGVYAVTPKSAGRVVAMMIKGDLVSVTEAQVKDIDEHAFRQGRVRARLYGEMRVPCELRYIQAVKSAGRESEELVLSDMGAYVAELMDEQPQCHFIMGSGSTVAAVMQELELENSLLGVDIVFQGSLVASDVTEQQLYQYVTKHRCKLIVTVIGGQGHLLGRGNQQLSPRVIEAIGRENIIVLATKTKLEALSGKPLLVDSGDAQCNESMAGLITVITGYNDAVLYTVANVDEDT